MKHSNEKVVNSLEVIRETVSMSWIEFTFVFLALVAVTGNAKSASPVTAEVIPYHNEDLFPGRIITLTMAYSRIGNTETLSNNIDLDMDGKRFLRVKFGVSHAFSNNFPIDPSLKIKFYTKSSDDKDYSMDVAGSLNILKVKGGTPYTKRFYHTFDTKDPNSDINYLPSREILINPAEGYYNEANDELIVAVTCQFPGKNKGAKPANRKIADGKRDGIIIGSVVASVILVSVVIVFLKRRGYICPTDTSVSLSVESTTMTQFPPPITTQVSHSDLPPSYESTYSQNISLSTESVELTHSQGIPLSTLGQPIQGTPVK